MANFKSIPSAKPIPLTQKSIIELVERYPIQTTQVLKIWLKHSSKTLRR